MSSSVSISVREYTGSGCGSAAGASVGVGVGVGVGVVVVMVVVLTEEVLNLELLDATEEPDALLLVTDPDVEDVLLLELLAGADVEDVLLLELLAGAGVEEVLLTELPATTVEITVDVLLGSVVELEAGTVDLMVLVTVEETLATDVAVIVTASITNTSSETVPSGS